MLGGGKLYISTLTSMKIILFIVDTSILKT